MQLGSELATRRCDELGERHVGRANEVLFAQRAGVRVDIDDTNTKRLHFFKSIVDIDGRRECRRQRVLHLFGFAVQTLDAIAPTANSHTCGSDNDMWSKFTRSVQENESESGVLKFIVGKKKNNNKNVGNFF
jgi:hypothetical protein